MKTKLLFLLSTVLFLSQCIESKKTSPISTDFCNCIDIFSENMEETYSAQNQQEKDKIIATHRKDKKTIKCIKKLDSLGVIWDKQINPKDAFQDYVQSCSSGNRFNLLVRKLEKQNFKD